MFQRKTLTWTLLAVLTIAAVGSVDLHAERLPLRIYNASNGLAHDRIRCVFADSRDFLWFCTADGLSRFDGSHFVNYGLEQGLPHTSVEALVEAGPGVYWIGTVGGLARLQSAARASGDAEPVSRGAALADHQDRARPALTRISLGSDAASNHVFALMIDRAGRMWVGTAGGLFVLERPLAETQFRRVAAADVSIDRSAPGQVRALAESADGVLWIGTLSGLFRRTPDGRVVRDHSVRATEAIRALLVDRLGRLWIGHDHGLTLAVPAPLPASPRPSSMHVPAICRATSRDVDLSAAPGETCQVDAIAGVPLIVRSLSESADGRVWVGTAGGLIACDGERCRAYSEKHGLPDDTINDVAEDRAHNVWIGTDASGVVRLSSNGFVSFRESDGLRHGYVTAIAQGRAGRVRAGGGWPVLNEFDGERFTSHRLGFARTLPWAPLYDVLEDHTGDVWVGTPNGLFRFGAITRVADLAAARPKAVYTVASGLPATRVAPAFEDSRGDLWMSAYLESAQRVVRWQRSTGRFQQYPETDSQAEPLRDPALAEDRAGSVWLGSSQGLARRRDGSFATIRIGGDTGIIRVTGLHVDPRGRLWVATRGAGLYRSDDPEAEHPRFTNYTVANGLSSGTVWCLTSDDYGNLYAGTARGVDRLGPERGQFTHFTVADGLAGREVITAFRDREGALWFGTFTGISRITPLPAVAASPPSAWIGGLRIRGIAQPLADLGESHITVGDLEPRQNQIRIDYFGLSAASTDLTYQYQLQGTQSGWTPATPERTVSYAELAPGSYRFLVRAVTADGQASDMPASVAFTIVPPVWQRGWFLTTGVLLAIASAYGVHRYRVTRLLAIERLRSRIASDLHDDLGSSLSQISILSEVLRTQLGDAETHIAASLSRIGRLSRESVDSMGDIVWAIDPARDTPVHLLQRMRRVANELLGTAGVEVHFETSGDEGVRHFPADVRREVLLIFKEILNNIVRHADASAVSVEVRVTSRQLRLTVADNGRGFDTAAADGQGLRNMQRRASSLGGSFQVTSAPGGGTRATVTVSVH